MLLGDFAPLNQLSTKFDKVSFHDAWIDSCLYDASQLCLKIDFGIIRELELGRESENQPKLFPCELVFVGLKQFLIKKYIGLEPEISAVVNEDDILDFEIMDTELEIIGNLSKYIFMGFKNTFTEPKEPV